MKVMINWTVLSGSLRLSNEPNKPERWNWGSCTQMNEGAAHETKVDQEIMKWWYWFIYKSIFFNSDNRSRASVENNSCVCPWRSLSNMAQMSLWISSLSNFFFAIAKLTTTFSQKTSLCPGKNKFIRKFSSPLACIFTCNLFFTVLKRVDKAGLRFYLYLFPFLMANIFILKVFTTVLQTAKKKEKKKKERVSLASLLLLFFIQINFFGWTG